MVPIFPENTLQGPWKTDPGWNGPHPWRLSDPPHAQLEWVDMDPLIFACFPEPLFVSDLKIQNSKKKMLLYSFFVLYFFFPPQNLYNLTFDSGQ